MVRTEGGIELGISPSLRSFRNHRAELDPPPPSAGLRPRRRTRDRLPVGNESEIWRTRLRTVPRFRQGSHGTRSLGSAGGRRFRSFPSAARAATHRLRSTGLDALPDATRVCGRNDRSCGSLAYRRRIGRLRKTHGAGVFVDLTVASHFRAKVRRNAVCVSCVRHKVRCVSHTLLYETQNPLRLAW